MSRSALAVVAVRVGRRRRRRPDGRALDRHDRRVVGLVADLERAERRIDARDRVLGMRDAGDRLLQALLTERSSSPRVSKTPSV
jgi:hypothetical protein